MLKEDERKWGNLCIPLEAKLTEKTTEEIRIPLKIFFEWHPKLGTPFRDPISPVYVGLYSVAEYYRSCTSQNKAYLKFLKLLDEVEQHSEKKVFTQAFKESCSNVTNYALSINKDYAINALEAEIIKQSKIIDDYKIYREKISRHRKACQGWLLGSSTPFLTSTTGEDGVVALEKLLRSTLLRSPTAMKMHRFQDPSSYESKLFASMGQVMPRKRVTTLIQRYTDDGLSQCRIALDRLKKTNAEARAKGLRPLGKRTPIPIQ